jgi:hypothetical protein
MQLFSNALKDEYSCKLIMREQKICEVLPLLGPVGYVCVGCLTIISVPGRYVCSDGRTASELRLGKFVRIRLSMYLQYFGTFPKLS